MNIFIITSLLNTIIDINRPVMVMAGYSGLINVQMGSILGCGDFQVLTQIC